jgi:hypothetical protein
MRLVEAELAVHSAHSMHITQQGAQPVLPRSDPTLTGQAAAVAMPGSPAQAGADAQGGMGADRAAAGADAQGDMGADRAAAGADAQGGTGADRAAAGNSLPSPSVTASQALPLPPPGGSYQQFVASIRHSLAEWGALQAFEAAQPDGAALNSLLESLWLQRSAAAQPPPSAAAAPAREGQHVQQGSKDDAEGTEWELLVERCSDATRHYVWLLLGERIFNKAILRAPAIGTCVQQGHVHASRCWEASLHILQPSRPLYMAVDPGC